MTDLSKLSDAINLITQDQTNTGTPVVKFIKNSYHPEKVRRESIFERMFYNANFKKEIIRINNDIKHEFQNLLSIGCTKQELPIISQTLFNQLMLQIDKSNLNYIEYSSAPEFTRKELSKIATTQNNIYKILKKIEEDLIDEQDTAIKDRRKDNIDYKKLSLLIDKSVKENIEKYRSDSSQLNRNVTPVQKEDRGMMGFLWDTAVDVGITSAVMYSGKKIYENYRQSRNSNVRPNDPHINRPAPTTSPHGSPTHGNTPSRTQPPRTNTNHNTPGGSTSHGTHGSRGSRGSRVLNFLSRSLRGTKILYKVLRKPFQIIFLVVDIGQFYINSQTEHPEWDVCRRSIYAFVAGLTYWTYDLVAGAPEFLKLIGELIIDCIEWLLKNWEEAAKESSVKGLYETLKPILTWVSKAISKILEYVIDPIIDFFKMLLNKAGGKIGDECGLLAVQEFENSLEFFRNVLPNGVTWELLTGSNEILERLQKRGLYQWNKLGESKLTFTGAEDLANKLTTREIDELLKHDDLDSVIRMNLQKARQIKKERGITDADVLKNNYENPYLLSLIQTFDNASGAFERSWKPFISKTLAGGTKEFTIAFGIISVLYNGNEIANIRNGCLEKEEAETLLNRLMSRYKGLVKFKGYSDKSEELYFTVFGTVMVHYLTYDIPENAVNKDPEVHQVLKIIGYIDDTRQFHADKFNPEDIIVSSIIRKNAKSLKHLYTNIVYNTPLKPKADKVEKINTAYSTNKLETNHKEPTVSDYDTSETYIDPTAYGRKYSHNKETESNTASKNTEQYIDPTAEARSYKSADLTPETMEKPETYTDPTAEARKFYEQNVKENLASKSKSSPEDFEDTRDVKASKELNAFKKLKRKMHNDRIDPVAAAKSYYTRRDLTDVARKLIAKRNRNINEETQNQQNNSQGSSFNLNNVLKATIYEKNGKWYSNNPFVDACIVIESGRNANAVNPSGATGLFQFLEGTAKECGVKDRLDPFDSLEGFKKYVQSNAKILERNNIPVTPTNLYLVHQQGPTGFPQIYNALKNGTTSELSDSRIKNIKNNFLKGKKNYTNPEDWYRDWNKRMSNLMKQSIPTENFSLNKKTNLNPATNSDSPSTFAFNSSQRSTEASGTSGFSNPRGSSNVLNSSGTSGGGTPNQTMQRAINYASHNALDGSIGKCARYVANALESAGFKFERQPSAYMYHSKGILKKMGFNMIHVGQKGYSPIPGDIAVINRFKTHEHGHICMFDGKNWVSDFRQRKLSPYRVDVPPESGIFIYRYGGEDIEGVDESSFTQDNDVQPQYNTQSYRENKVNNSNNTSVNINISNGQTTLPMFKEGDAEKLFNYPLSWFLD